MKINILPVAAAAAIVTSSVSAMPSSASSPTHQLEDRTFGLLFSGLKGGQEFWLGDILNKKFSWNGIGCSVSKSSGNEPASWIKQGKKAPLHWTRSSNHNQCIPTAPAAAASPSCESRDHILGWLSGDFCCSHKSNFQSGNTIGDTFTWGGKTGCSVRPAGHSGDSGSVSCPTGWGYSSHHSCCTPNSKDIGSDISFPTDLSSCTISKLPSCSSGKFCLSSWSCSNTGTHAIIGRNPLPSHTTKTIASATSSATSAFSCKSGEFWWHPKSCCLPSHVSPPSIQPPTSDKTCPTLWYWHSTHACCVPHKAGIDTQPKLCSNNAWSWHGKDLCCKSSTPDDTSCSKASSLVEFFWNQGGKKLCIPSGGFTSCPKPPTQYGDCPSQWGWHTGKQCCTPKVPTPPTPICETGCSWLNHRCEHNTPTPSKPASHKRSRAHHVADRSLPLDGRPDAFRCMSGLTACPVAGALNDVDAYECIDPLVEVDSCGGCASLGQGQVCSANESCVAGQCTTFF